MDCLGLAGWHPVAFAIPVGRLWGMKASPRLLTLGLLAACGGSVPQAPPLVPRPGPGLSEHLDPELASAIGREVEAIERDPTGFEAWFKLGMTYEAHSQHDLALACYQGAVDLQPASDRARYRLGLALGRSGRLEEAVLELERVLDMTPSYAAARIRLGYLLLDSGRTLDAKEVFRADMGEPAAVQGVAQAELELGNYEEALAVLEDPRVMSGPHRPLTQRLLGLSLARLGRTEEAQAALAMGVAARPVFSDPWSRQVAAFKVGASAIVMRAQKMVDNGRIELALELLGPLRDGADPRVLRLTGVALARAGDFSGAAEALGEALDLEPGDPDLVLALAAALSQCLRNSEAVGVIESFLVSHPSSPAIWDALSGLLKGDHLRVVDIRDRALGLGQAGAGVEIASGLGELALGRNEDAVASFSRAISLDPGRVEAWRGRARARAALGHAAEANSDLEEATALEQEAGEAVVEGGDG